MSKKSRFDELNDDVEEDFLDVDKPIQGQNYVCMSFVSPEKILAKKEDYYFDQFFKKRMQVLEKKFDEKFQMLLEGDPETVDSALVKKLHKRFLRETKDAAEKCMKDFGDFKYANEEAIESNFHQENDFQSTIRGIKVRGTYNTYREAQIRAKVLQRMDPSFHIFIGQVGYWLPWDPTADRIENQEYGNKQLNEIVKKYKTNETKRDMFYEEQKRERKQAKLQKQLEKEKEKVEPTVMKIVADDKPAIEASKDDVKEAVEQAVDQAIEEAAEVNDQCNDCPCEEKNECQKRDDCPCEPENCPQECSGECPCDDKKEDDVDTSQLEELLCQAKSKLAVGDEADEEVAMEEAVDRLTEMDPWMARKLNGVADEDDIHAPLEEDEDH